MGMESFFVKLGFSSIDATPTEAGMRTITKKHLKSPLKKRKWKYHIKNSVQVILEPPFHSEIALIGFFKDYDYCCRLICDIADAINKEIPIEYCKVMEKNVPFNQNMNLVSLIKEEYKEKHTWFVENIHHL